jgi:predicted Zn-dependent protease
MTALAMNRPREALDMLERIDPNKGLMRGFFLHWTDLTTALHLLGNHRRELVEARRGMELYPGNTYMAVNVARALAALGRPDEARTLLGEHPAHPPAHWVPAAEDAWITSQELASHGFLEDAAAMQDWCLEWFESLGPERLEEPLYRQGYARMLYVAGRLDEAEHHYRELTRQIPDSVSYLGYLGSIAALRGDRARALHISDSLQTLQHPYRFGSIAYWQARIAAVLGDGETAVEKLRQALDEGFQFSDAVLRDEDLRELRGYEPLEEVLRPKG